MTEYKYQYSYEYPADDGGPDETIETDVVFVYTWKPGSPARIHYDEFDHPAEPDEVELIRVDIVGEERPFEGNPAALRIEGEAEEMFATNYNDLYATLIENAREEENR